MARVNLRAKIREILGDSHTDEIENQIVALHLSVVDPLKDEVDSLKIQADKLTDVQKELDELKAAGDGGYKEKYEEAKKSLEDFQAAQTAKEAKEAKEKAYRELLKESGVSEKRIDTIVKVTNFDAVEMDGEKIKDADKHTAAIKTEWADFITTENIAGANTPTPRANTGGDVTRESIMQIKDATERRAAIAQNLNLFKGDSK